LPTQHHEQQQYCCKVHDPQIGGKGVANAPMASAMPAIAKARTSRLLESLIAALIGCLFGSIGCGVI
jgi:hypothetical protein